MIKYTYEIKRTHSLLNILATTRDNLFRLTIFRLRNFIQTDASFRTEKFEQNHDKSCQFHNTKNVFYKFVRSK